MSDWRSGLAVIKELAKETNFENLENTLLFVIALQLEEFLDHQSFISQQTTT